MPILAGAVAFGVLVLTDLAEPRSLLALRLASMALSALLLAYGILACALDPWKLGLSIAPRIVAGVVGAAFLYLLIRSLLLEVPTAKGQDAAAPKRLVTTGTYALVRHPGVIWFLFVLLGAAAAADSAPLLVAAPIWAAADVIYAAVQDRIFFPRLFGDAYGDYRRSTPFIIPNPASVRTCCETWNAPLDRSSMKPGGPNGNRV